MTGPQAQKRPLMLAALNGLSVARVSGREDGRHDATRVPIDERVSSGLVRCDLFSLLPDSGSSSLPRPASAACRGLSLSMEEDLIQVCCVRADPFQHLLFLHCGLCTFIKLAYWCLIKKSSPRAGEAAQ